MKTNIYLLTEERYLNPKLNSEYVRNIIKEDQLLIKALEAQGYQVERYAWDLAEKQLPTGCVAVFRSTWNYFEKITQFQKWLSDNADRVQFVNPFTTIQWNLDKEYLFDLAKGGVAIPETLVFERNTELTLSKISIVKGWQKIIVKPAIAATAFNTFKLEGDEILAFESEFQCLNKTHRYLIQEFQESVVKKGEVSLIFIAGTYSHAILKKAKKGDYRVQDDFGGSVHDYTPTSEQIDLGERAIQACPEKPVYGRVDMLLSNKKQWVVTEVELIEPELWLRTNPSSAKKLAKAIKDYTVSLGISS